MQARFDPHRRGNRRHRPRPNSTGGSVASEKPLWQAYEILWLLAMAAGAVTAVVLGQIL